MASARSTRRDRLSADERSALMSRIRSRDTGPERDVATLLTSLRYRFVRHDANLPGTPDFILARHRVAILVHGCFWHAHSCKRGRSVPCARRTFWLDKKTRNAIRDVSVRRALRRRGYSIVVVWECMLRKPHVIRSRIRAAVAACSKRRDVNKKVTPAVVAVRGCGAVSEGGDTMMCPAFSKRKKPRRRG